MCSIQEFVGAWRLIGNPNGKDEIIAGIWDWIVR